MVELSIQIEGQIGLTWPRWQKLVDAVEQAGFAGLYRSDHFVTPNATAAPADLMQPNMPALELIVSLTYLADHTQRIQFGPLVAPLSFRDPRHLVRQAAALDDLSGGRMILGVGAGWMEREHTMFGYDLGSIDTRMKRFAEGLEIMTRLLKSDEPVTFDGTFYQLKDAVLLPRPQRPGGPRILIGGNGPKRTLPLVARYADIWNSVFVEPDDFRKLSTQLDALLKQEGRAPESVKRTAFTGLSLTTEPDQLAAQIQAYAQAGAEELVLHWKDYDDIDGLKQAAELIIPRL